MASVYEAQIILKALGMPPAQQNPISGMTLLALCQLTPDAPWSEATRRPCTVTKGVMDYLRTHYNADYAPNSRETFRRQVLHQFVQGRIADYNPFDPSLPTNSPRAHYAITETALDAVLLFGSPQWQRVARDFRKLKPTLIEQYERERQFHMVPVVIPDGQTLHLSPGRHNEVQKAIVEAFAPRFAPSATLLYLGDTAKKALFLSNNELADIQIPITEHNKLPDVVLYEPGP